MSKKRTLGKIEKVYLGFGGYQGAMFGVTFVFKLDHGGVTDFWGGWGTYPAGAKYAKESWDESHSKTYARIRELMLSARVSEFSQLIDIPVEITWTGASEFGSSLESWRVLGEVL